uniref:F-box domain-containing protein n=1 Tax=viral metagenome TaxID=1070528 RepID=A0A6C0CA18_9ZZZZ
MQNICLDVLKIIIHLLDDKEKMMMLSVSKELNKFKMCFTYHKKTLINKISELDYFDNFESIRAIGIIEKFPSHAKSVHFDYLGWMGKSTEIPQSVTHLTFANHFHFASSNMIPPSVTHATIDQIFDWRSIWNSSITHLTINTWVKSTIKYIPASVTHLTIHRFDDSIKNAIPRTVTHLTLNHNFGGCINYAPLCTESLMTHLSFGDSFNGTIVNVIPQSVTHLSFGYSFSSYLDNRMPQSVVEIKLHQTYNLPISNEIASRVKIIKIDT